jgi:polyisoprenoid-binding protein YceI
MRRLLPFVLLLVVPLTGPAAAQAPANLTIQAESRFWIDGTSNRSDWTVYADDVTGRVTLGGGEAPSVSRVEVVISAAGMESRNSTIMDRLMYGALNVQEHPTVRFVLTDPVRGVPGSSGGAFSLAASGHLSLAGSTRDVTVVVKATPLGDGRYRFTGSYPLKMSEYGITPPVAMFGQLRTGDGVVVHFDLVAGP